MSKSSVVEISVKKPVYSRPQSAQKQDLRPIQVIRDDQATRIEVQEHDGVRIVSAPVHPTEPDPVEFGA